MNTLSILLLLTYFGIVAYLIVRSAERAIVEEVASETAAGKRRFCCEIRNAWRIRCATRSRAIEVVV